MDGVLTALIFPLDPWRSVSVTRPRRSIALLLPAASVSASAAGEAYGQSQVCVDTLSGSSEVGFADRNAQVVQLNRPHGPAIDGKGNIYVSDCGNHAIRDSAVSKDGNADGVGAGATLRPAVEVGVERLANIYVADYPNHAIRASRKRPEP